MLITEEGAHMERQRRSRRFWEHLVQEYEEGDESSPQFASRHQVHVATFRWWLYRLRRERRDLQSPEPVAFVELIPHEVHGSCEMGGYAQLRLPGGVELETAELPPPEYLAAVSRALAG